MATVVHSVWVFIETILALGFLALAAGFSPTLYAAQVGSSSKSVRPVRQARALVTGVAAAIAVMLLLFQFFHLETLLHIAGSTVSAFAMSTAVNLLVGAACIYGGLRYGRSRRSEKPLPTTTRSTYALFSFGFVRTLLSLSGLTATFIGANLIAETDGGLIVHVVLTAFFLAIAVMPFVGIMFLMVRQPERIRTLLDLVRQFTGRLPYRIIISTAAVIFGCGVILFQMLRAVA